VAYDRFREVLSVIFELSELKAPRSPEYVPNPIELEDHVPAHILEHPEDLVPAEDEAPIEAYILEKRLLLTAPRPGCEVRESSAAVVARQPGPTMDRSVDCSFVDTMETRESSEFYSRHHDAQKDRVDVRAEIEVLRRERLAYEQESIQTREALARSEACIRGTSCSVRDSGASPRVFLDSVMIVSTMQSVKFYGLPPACRWLTQVPSVTLALTATTTTVTEAQLQALMYRGVTAIMAEAKASRDSDCLIASVSIVSGMESPYS
nr:hypothetical protein [Tanacetum cinerariifolium]